MRTRPVYKLLTEADWAAAEASGATATALDQQAAQLADLYNARYFDATNGYYQTGSQTAQVVPLAFGIAQGDQRAAAITALSANLLARDNHLASGFIGSAYLMPGSTARR